jgi:hypothetical protein
MAVKVSSVTEFTDSSLATVYDCRTTGPLILSLRWYSTLTCVLDQSADVDSLSFVFVHQEPPLLWRTFPEGGVTLSEGGAVATQTDIGHSLATTEIELTEGRHYWEVELLSGDMSMILVGISRPNLDPTGGYWQSQCTDGWFIDAESGSLYGNGKQNGDRAGSYTQGDHVGVLLDLNDGSLRFFKNGVQHGPGYPAGSVTGPVVAAVQTYYVADSVRLLPNAEAPIIN